MTTEHKINELDERQLKRVKKRGKWPKWLRTPKLIRWAFKWGPFVYRIASWTLKVFGQGNDDG